MENDWLEEELKLVQELKNAYCEDQVGNQFKETEPEKAAEIIYKIGMIYKKRSPDKICLIKSVGLLNAAIVRKPSNVSLIKSDLIETCLHILKLAKATNQKMDLISKANEVSLLVNEARTEVTEFLNSPTSQKIANNLEGNNLNRTKTIKISTIRYINNAIANKYKQIMANLSQFCENVMGKPPCEYAIVGMGSLARSEITFYSDFEHIILLTDYCDYKSHLQYFRWYSVIFQTIILNMQETIIPSLNIKTLNDQYHGLGNWYFDAHTPCGISFDGMMPHACKFPLGRFEHTKDKPFETELIKPVSEMLLYLRSEADLKNGYHLADILTKTCFVFGNEKIFEQFESGISKFRNRASKAERIEEVKQQVREDLDNFSTRFRLVNLKSNQSINVKKLVYRSTTLFIAALARIHNISAKSCFDIISELNRKKKISQNTRDKLFFAIAIACEMRLRVYTSKNSQCDVDIDLKQDGEKIQKFLDVVGAASTINYFQIAYCLQCEVAKQLNFTKLHFYSDPQLINISIGLAFGMSGFDSNFSNEPLKIGWDLSEFSFDTCIKQLETSNSIDYVTKASAGATIDINLMKSLARQLFSTNIHDEALEFYQRILAHYENKTSNESTDEDIAWIYKNIGVCTESLQQYQTALDNYHKSSEIMQKISRQPKKDLNVAKSFYQIGNCLRMLFQYEDAIKYSKQSLEIMRTISLDQQKDANIAMILSNIGLCLTNLDKNDEALIYLKQSLEIYRFISPDQQTDGNVASLLNNIGLCLQNSHQLDDALAYLIQSLEIFQNVPPSPYSKEGFAYTLENLGRCLLRMHQLDKALYYSKQSLDIFLSISLDQNKDYKAGRAHKLVGVCLLELNDADGGLNHFKQSLKILQNLFLDQKNKNELGLMLNNVGFTLMTMGRFDNALTHLKQSVEVYETIPQDLQCKIDYAMSLHNLGGCLVNMQQHNNAPNYLEKALALYKNMPSNSDTENKIAAVKNFMEQCSTNIH